MNTVQGVKVWDIAVRIFHWSLVFLFTVSYITGEDVSALHVYAGYGVLGLITFRFLWGFIGTRHARFSDFVFGPDKVMHYTKSLFSSHPEHYLGHNPLGGWMVVALLISLMAVSWSGLELYAADEGKGPLASGFNVLVSDALANGDDDDDEHERHGGGGDELWEEIHEFLANFTLFLIFFHSAGVFIGTFIHKEKLVQAMISGYKNGKKD
jgi:cytochrome b